MGCFSVTCVLSGLSIYSQDAVYIPLKRAKYTHLTEHGEVAFGITNNFVSNDGAFGLFVPKFLPIFGNYDKYGRLENIIEDGISNIALPHIFLDKVPEYGCFVDRTMWDWAVKHDRKAESVYNNHAVGKHIELFADKLGFIYEGQFDELGRYNRVFHHINAPNIKVYTDKTWAHVDSDYGIYTFGVLSRFYHSQGTEIGKTFQFLKDISALEIQVRNSIIDYRNFQKSKVIFPRYINDTIYNSPLRDMYDLYIDLDIDILTKAMSDLFHLSHIMYGCNRMFIPQLSGPQFGDYHLLREMYSESKMVCDVAISGHDE